MVRFEVACEAWPLREPFAIARETIGEVPLVYLQIHEGLWTGRGEAVGVDYKGETPASIAAQITAFLESCESMPTREGLLSALPAGGARNAIDCALWDLEAKRGHVRAWDAAGLGPAQSRDSLFTISLGSPADMARAAAAAPPGAVLKLKLGGGDGIDIARVEAVRRAVDRRSLLVDVNEGWSFGDLQSYEPALAALGVQLIEQPLAAGHDACLSGYRGATPLCADESFDWRGSFDRLGEAYRFVNIKLDKCGGLTEGLACLAEARRRNLGVMIGSMLGTSLGMAPAFLLAQRAGYADLDGPLLLARDRKPSLTYENGSRILPFDADVWG